MTVGSAIVALLLFSILVAVLISWMLKPKRGKNLNEGKDDIADDHRDDALHGRRDP
jgi:hypothetical protein